MSDGSGRIWNKVLKEISFTQRFPIRRSLYGLLTLRVRSEPPEKSSILRGSASDLLPSFRSKANRWKVLRQPMLELE